MPLSLVSLNIEGRMHIPRVRAFLTERSPDVVCLMELCEADVGEFAALSGPHHLFLPMMRVAGDSRIVAGTGPQVIGVGIFSRTPFIRSARSYYHPGFPVAA